MVSLSWAVTWHLVQVLHTLNGKEYVTPDRLKREIKVGSGPGARAPSGG